MLLIRCAACREKLWKYVKRGPGEVLRCHRDRQTRIYELRESGGQVLCSCGKVVGRDRGSFIAMKQGAFVYSGTKTSL